MSLRVLEPGLCSLIVDGGRPRTRSLGVPSGGPADHSAFVLGNSLLGNPASAAALEITLAGPVLQALARTGIVVLGAPVSLTSARQRLVCNQSFTLEAGEELHIGGIRHGARTYLCTAGGFQTPEILGSRSALAPVQRDDVLPCAESSARRRTIHCAFDWPQVPALSEHLLDQKRMLHVLPGPEADWFPGAGWQLPEGHNSLESGGMLSPPTQVLAPPASEGRRKHGTQPVLRHEASPSAVFTVRPESNRMGLRLSGEPVPVPPREMVSQPVAPGAIQVTRDGQLILLGVDGQTIGGYPRIAHVISADLDLVGQLRPGDQLSFQTVTLAEAERLGREKRTLLERWCLRLREAATAF